MKVGIHLQGNSDSLLNTPFERKFIDILKFNEIDYEILNIHDENFWEKMLQVDAFIFRYGELSSEIQFASTIMPIIEGQLKNNCFPNQNTCWHFDDKIKQYYLMKVHNFPIAQSWIFWDKRKCLDWLSTDANYPIVFKLKGGAGSANVVKVKSYSEASKIVNRIFKKGIKNNRIPSSNALHYKYFSVSKMSLKFLKKLGRIIKGYEIDRIWLPNVGYALFQKYLPNNDFDTRVLIIGNRAFAFRRMNRKNDFRSSGSGIIDYDPSKIDLTHLTNAFKISSKMNFQSMAYDFIYDESGESKFCEISYTYLDSAVYNCPGYWDSNLLWHEGNFWPQYFILMDLLELKNLKQPILKIENYEPPSSFYTFKQVFFNWKNPN